MDLAVADRRWNGKKVIVAASGPSLNSNIAEICNGEIVLAVNDAIRLFPKAEVLYSCDADWWEVNNFVLDFTGERWTSHSLSPRNDKRNLKNQELFHIIEGKDLPGFSRDPEFIHYGNNSGFQAVNLAILFGAKEIVLVGFDMRNVGDKSHFFGNHKAPLRSTSAFSVWVDRFEKANRLLNDVRIVNCTPNSALTCFPMMPLEQVLNPVCEAAE